MRIWLLSFAALILGASVGLGVTWWEFRGVREYFVPMSIEKAVEAGEAVAVVEGGMKFDFGVLDHDQTREHTIVIHNKGTKPLNVNWEEPSCGMCIQNSHKFTGTTVKPGGSYELVVTYATKKPSAKFSEAVNLSTNDPTNPKIRYEIVGDVIRALSLEPETLALNSVLTSEPTTASVKLMGYQSDKLELVKCEFKGDGSMFEVTAKPLDESQVKKYLHARTGLELSLRIMPGLPIGPIAQTAKLTVMTDRERTIELQITGTVAGDISIIGKGYETARAEFNMGVIDPNVGRSGELFVLVKGPHRNDVKLSVGEVDPAEFLKVKIGEPSSFLDGKAVKYPLTISVPKGAPPMNRLGNSQGKSARIVLETTHPISKQLPINVFFAIE